MTDLESYSDREFLAALKPLIGTLVIDKRLAPSDNPRAVLLGGQSGAGKTTLHDVFLALEESNAIVINGDDYRSVHPRFRQICAQYGIDSPAHTAAWAGRMVEAIVDALSIMGYNLIIEGTLRTSEVPLKTARLLRDRGYSVSLALMAVKACSTISACTRAASSASSLARTMVGKRAKRSSGSSSEHGPPKKALTTNISSNASNKQEPSASFLVRGRTSLRGR